MPIQPPVPQEASTLSKQLCHLVLVCTNTTTWNDQVVLHLDPWAHTSFTSHTSRFCKAHEKLQGFY